MLTHESLEKLYWNDWMMLWNLNFG